MGWAVRDDQLYRKGLLTDHAWQPVGGPNLTRRATITAIQSNAFFRVSGPQPRYAGSQACIECHEGIHTTEMDTRHAHAFETLKLAQQQGNAACLPCHTVGYGLPSGFVNETATPWLAGVQCENCHGPAANHAANEDDLTARPRVELAATVCGGCHTGSHQPTFDEWKTSGHAEVVEDMNPSRRISNCGRCHSGSARLSLLKNEPLPVGDANVGIVCATCHDPHRRTANPAQLRNPVSSTNDYYLTTSDVFTNKYDAQINICAQCHNHRGASWASTDRPPHHSPQYNMLLGTVGELADGSLPNQPAGHVFVEKQCAGCHMQTEEYVSEAQPAVTGHKFNVERYDACLSCHPFAPDKLVALVKTAVGQRIQQIKTSLDLWGSTAAPLALRTNYGASSWEYEEPGDLSPDAPAPTESEQSLIPEKIQKARFNLYLVLHDGSFGAHNGPYAITLLDTASDWVDEELGGVDR